MKDTDIIAAIAPDAVSLMDKAIAEIKRLRQENATLTAERDEARRSVCCQSLPSDYKAWSQSAVDSALKLIAAQQGWDCFKEATDDR